MRQSDGCLAQRVQLVRLQGRKIDCARPAGSPSAESTQEPPAGWVHFQVDDPFAGALRPREFPHHLGAPDERSRRAHQTHRSHAGIGGEQRCRRGCGHHGQWMPRSLCQCVERQGREDEIPDVRDAENYDRPGDALL